MSSLFKRKNSRYWWYKHGSVRRSTKTTDKQVARLYLKKWDRLYRGDTDVAEETLGTLVQTWFEYNTHTGSIAQASRNRWQVERFIRHTSLVEPEQLTTRIMQDYVIWLMKQFAPKTIQNKMASISSFCRFLQRRGILESNPCANIERPKVKKLHPRFLDKDQIEQCLEIARHQNTDLWLLCYIAIYTGMRLGELRMLEGEDFYWEQKIIVIPVTKSNRPRSIPMSQKFIQTVKPLIGKGLVFPGRTQGSHRTKNYFIKQLDPIRDAMPCFTDIPGHRVGRGFHLFRHTFCSQHAMAGTPLAKICQWAGHKNIQTTMRYSHLAPIYDKDVENF